MSFYRTEAGPREKLVLSHRTNAYDLRLAGANSCISIAQLEAVRSLTIVGPVDY
jgi:hypothetical protein